MISHSANSLSARHRRLHLWSVVQLLLLIVVCFVDNAQAQSSSQVSVSVSPSPMPFGEQLQVTIAVTCSNSLAGGTALFLVDGSPAEGLDLDPTGAATIGYLGSLLTIGNHKATVNFTGSSGCAQTTSSQVSFEVIPNNLPVPAVTVGVVPQAIPSGEYGIAPVSVNCASACGTGYFLIDGNYAGGAVLDGSGNAFLDVRPSVPVGHHTAKFEYLGNTSFAPAQSTEFPFDVIVDTLPAPTVTTTVTPSPILPGQSASIDIFVGCHAACGTGVLVLDGGYLAGVVLDAGGRGQYQTPTNLPPGHHTMAYYYYGDANNAPTDSTPLDFVVGTPGPSLTASISPTQIPFGEHATLTAFAACTEPCGATHFVIDGQYAGGLQLDGSNSASLDLLPGYLTLGHHLLVAYYRGNATDAPSSTVAMPFDVVSDNLPVPTIVAQITPLMIPAGESANINIVSSCATACGGGYILIDGNYGGGAEFNSNGNAGYYTARNLPIGPHTLVYTYWGNTSFAPTSSTPLNFSVVPNNLSIPVVTLQLPSTTILQGQPAIVTVSVSCTPTCGGGQLFVDATYIGGLTLDSTGSATGQFNLGFVTPGQHTLSFQYAGDINNGLATGTLSFTTVAQPSSIFDAGTVTLTVNGIPETVPYSSAQNGTSSLLASALVAAINADPAAAVTATTAASTIRLIAKTTGAASNYPFSLTSTYDTQDFNQASFTAATAAGTLTGGLDPSTGVPASVYSYSITQPQSNTSNPGGSGYDPVGNIVAYTDSVNGTWSHAYDNLNRLTASTQIAVGATATQSGCWSYDSFGNLQQAYTSNKSFLSASGPCQPDPSASTAQTNLNYTDGSNRITSGDWRDANGNFNQGSPAYDAAGNVINDLANTYAYDPDGRVCAVQTYGGMFGYLYNAKGQRVAKGTITSMSCDPTANGFQATNMYAIGPDGSEIAEVDGTGKWVHSNLTVGGQMIATYKNDGKGVHFQLSDWLGTRRVQTDYLGNVEDTCTSQPFGDQMNCTNPSLDASRHHFTGKERDTESGLDYFGARYYGSNMGRFQSPDDDSDQSPSDPQSWNLYSYVRNNPLTNTDPDGHDCVTQTATSGGGEVATVQTGACTGGSGNGTTKTFIAGTVTSLSYAADGKSLDVGYNAYGSDASTSTTTSSLNRAPAPDNPGIAVGYQRGGFNILNNTANGINMVAGPFVTLLQAVLPGALEASGPEVALGVGGVGAASAANRTVDVANLSNKIVRQMVTRGWTKQEVVETVEQGVQHSVANKATGGAATEFINPSTGKFVVVDNSTRQVLQVSGPGFLPNH